MVETLQQHTVAGECQGRLWWVGYVCPHRFAITAIELESSPGHWVAVPSFEGTSWATKEEMLAAIELRLRMHLQGVEVAHSFVA
jgi:hypothetical protein